MSSLYTLKNGSWISVGYVPPGPRHKYDPNVVCPLGSGFQTITVNQTTFNAASQNGFLGTFGTTEDLLIIVDGTITATTGLGNMLSFTGGRHAWILGVNGGRLVDTRTSISQKNILLRQNAYGNTFMDSLHLDATDAMSVDNLVIRGYAPYGTNRSGWTYPKTWMQNMRFDGSQYTGNFLDPHPDCFQKQTALGSTYFFNVTSSFIYQGFLIAGQSFSLDDPNTAGTQQEQWVEGLKNGSPAVDGELRLEKTNFYRRVDDYNGPALWVGWNTNEGNSGFPGEDNFPVYFDGEDNWVVGGNDPADTPFNGGGLVYPTGLGFFDGSHTYGGATAINSIQNTDSTSDYATWVPAAGISGKLRYGDRIGGDHVTEASLTGYDSPYAP